jgi:hypothetical protein
MRVCLHVQRVSAACFRTKIQIHQMFTKKAKRRSNILFKEANLEVLLKERENSNIKH